MKEQEKLLEELFNQDKGYTDKQKKILIAAIESFAEKGYASTSTSEIAKKAGVAEGTIFRHYKTKKDLLYFIVEPMIKKVVAPFVIKDMRKVLDQEFEEFEDFLRAMITNRLLFISKNKLLFRILIQEIPFQPELREIFKKHIATDVYTRFSELVTYYKDKGQLVDLPIGTIIRSVVSSIFGYIIARNLLAPEIDWNDENEMEQTIRFIMHGLKNE
jgi:AcrR family transcriptional regulator